MPKSAPPLPSGAALRLRAWIALGSNLGDRASLIGAALDRIAALPGVTVVTSSTMHTTAPVGGPAGQSDYLNSVAEIEVDLAVFAESGDGASCATRAPIDPCATSSTARSGLTAGAARSLLRRLLEIERHLGRVRDPDVRNAARTIDLDLLLVESIAVGVAVTGAPVVMDEPGLTLPHPRLHERLFVLAPLCEVAPELRHPRLGKTMQELLDTLDIRRGR